MNFEQLFGPRLSKVPIHPRSTPDVSVPNSATPSCFLAPALLWWKGSDIWQVSFRRTCSGNESGIAEIRNIGGHIRMAFRDSSPASTRHGKTTSRVDVPTAYLAAARQARLRAVASPDS